MASAIETILSGAFKILEASEPLQITFDSRNLGMAYAIPQGTAATVVNDFGPWQLNEVKQVFFRQGLLGAPLIEVQLILTWRSSAAGQYIVEAFLDKNVFVIEPGEDVSIDVRFANPQPFGDDPEFDAFQIPFTVTVSRTSLLGEQESRRSVGVNRSDGFGDFPPFD